MKIVFATGNPGKIREAAEILGEGFELVTPASLGITEDIPETGNTLRANSMQKADYIFKKTGLPCFADDSGLEVDILGGAPGVETARYAGPERDAKANRNARFRTTVTFIGPDGLHHFFDGVMEGHIAEAPAGNGGFGYDPIFVPEGYTETNAQLGEAVKYTISHRGKALRAMAEFLKQQ